MFEFIRFFKCLTWTTIRKIITDTARNRLTGLSAEMAFNGMLGLFPAIITILSAISLFETSIANTLGNLAIEFADIIPQQVWNLLFDFTEKAKISQGRSWFSLSFIAAIWVISGIIGSAINAIDLINQVPRKYSRPFWQKKVIAILLTIGTLALLITACFLLVIGDFLLRLALQQNWGELLLITWQIFSVIIIICIVATTIGIVAQIQRNQPRQRVSEEKNIITIMTIGISIILIQLVYSIFVFVESLLVNFDVSDTISNYLVSIWRVLSLPLSLGIVAICFAFIYRIGCSARSKSTPLMPGAILASLSWAIVSSLFRYYVANFASYNRIYGAVGTIIVLLLWLYLSSLVMLIGEQVNVVVGAAMLKKQLAACESLNKSFSEKQ